MEHIPATNMSTLAFKRGGLGLLKKKVISITAIIILSFFSLNVHAQTPINPQNLGAANIPVLSGENIPGINGVALQSKAQGISFYKTLNSIPCSSLIETDLSSKNITGESSPSVFCVKGSARLSNDLAITTNGAPVIIRIPGDLLVEEGARIAITSGNPDLVFIQITGDMDVRGNSLIQGTVLAEGSITLDPSAQTNGRLLSLNGRVNGIVNVDCTSCISTSTFGEITLKKTVINNEGGTATANDFQYFVSGFEIKSGQKYIFLPGNYSLGEFVVEGYTASPWSGNCSPKGELTLNPAEEAVCSITNDDSGIIMNISTSTQSSSTSQRSNNSPIVPNTGAGGNAALIFAILAGVITGYVGISREIKTLNK